MPRGAAVAHLAAAQFDLMRGAAAPLAERVRGDDDGSTHAGEPRQLRAQQAARRRIEAVEGLIEQQHPCSESSLVYLFWGGD